jgi:hypothetical protein
MGLSALKLELSQINEKYAKRFELTSFSVTFFPTIAYNFFQQ